MSRLEGCLYAVSPLEGRVLVLRAGLDGAEPMSRRAIARRLQTSSRRVARVEGGAVRKLRSTAKTEGCGAVGGMREVPVVAPLTGLAVGGVHAVLDRIPFLKSRRGRGSAGEGAVLGALAGGGRDGRRAGSGSEQGGRGSEQGKTAGPRNAIGTDTASETPDVAYGLLLVALLCIGLLALAVVQVRRRLASGATGTRGRSSSFDGPYSDGGAAAPTPPTLLLREEKGAAMSCPACGNQLPAENPQEGRYICGRCHASGPLRSQST